MWRSQHWSPSFQSWSTLTPFRTHKLWVRHFGSDPDIVGKPIVFDRRPFTICGVLRESYRFALPPGGPGPDICEIDVYMPEFLEPQARGTDNDVVSVVAKLRPGVRGVPGMQLPPALDLLLERGVVDLFHPPTVRES
jgi:hypothetical protein